MTIDFSAAADLWLESRCYQTPSALHGWLTGYLSAGARLTNPQWLQEAEAYLELDAEPGTGLSGFLIQFYGEVLTSLNNPDMGFELLLPSDEDADVSEQVDSLAQWSKGFLDGVGAAGTIKGSVADDVEEVLRDLDAFTHASVEDDSDPENETLYQSLVEHARVAALTVFYGLNDATATNAPKTLH